MRIKKSEKALSNLWINPNVFPYISCLQMNDQYFYSVLFGQVKLNLNQLEWLCVIKSCKLLISLNDNVLKRKEKYLYKTCLSIRCTL